MKAQLAKLHAEDIFGSRQTRALKRPQGPEREAALGWLVSIGCRADGCQYEGQLIAFEAATGLHHILYIDGEDEWINLSAEQIVWFEHLHRPISAGLKQGEHAYEFALVLQLALCLWSCCADDRLFRCLKCADVPPDSPKYICHKFDLALVSTVPCLYL